MYITYLLLAAPSHAATYDAEIAVPEDHPSTNLGISPSFSYAMRRALVHDKDASDQVVTTSDSRVRCVVEDGWLEVEFAATASNWPTSWPVKTECNHGGDKLKIAVVKMSAATDISKQPAAIVSNTITFTRVAGASGVMTYALPPTGFVNGTYNSTLNGVKCIVRSKSGGGHMVTLQTAASANMSSGTCSLPLSGGGSYTLGLDLDEATI